LVVDLGFAGNVQTEVALITLGILVVGTVVHALSTATYLEFGVVLVIDGRGLGAASQQHAGDGHSQCCLLHRFFLCVNNVGPVLGPAGSVAVPMAQSRSVNLDRN